MDNLEETVLKHNVKVRYSLKFPTEVLKSGDPKLKLDLDKHPENNVESMAESRILITEVRAVPERLHQTLFSDTYMQLAHERIKFYKTEKNLESARTKLNNHRIGMQKQWRDLRKKENDLRKSFIQFHKFVRENNDKRFRALKKLEDEKVLGRKRQAETDDLNKILNEVIDVTAQMDENIKKYKPCEVFLEHLVEIQEFKSVNDILDRYYTLSGAKDILLYGQQTNFEVLENARNEMMKLIEEKNFVIMGLNNQIANLQARYENANIKALESEELVTEIKNNAVRRLSEIDTVKNSIWNVYVHMASSKKHPIKIKKDFVEEQMMYINRTLTELSKVNKIIKKKSTKAK